MFGVSYYSFPHGDGTTNTRRASGDVAGVIAGVKSAFVAGVKSAFGFLLW